MYIVGGLSFNNMGELNIIYMSGYLRGVCRYKGDVTLFYSSVRLIHALTTANCFLCVRYGCIR